MTTAGAAPAPGSAGNGLSVTTQHHRHWRVLAVAGELDVATAPVLNDHLSRALVADNPPRIALELSGVRHCDSSGINAFVYGWKRARALNGELILVAPAPQVAEYLQRTGLDQAVTITTALPE